MRTGLWPQLFVLASAENGMQLIQTKQIQIVVNGQTRQAPADQNLTGLLAFLDIDPSRVAIELNRSIIQRKDWEQTVIADGAALEIVQFVGGG